jgi:hypothetical protein
VVGKFVEFYGAGVPNLPLADRATTRQHVARVRLDVRDLPDRRRDAALPRVLRPHARAHRARRGLRPRRRACGTTRAPRSRRTARRSNSTSARSSRRWPGPSARRTASR